MNKFVEKVLLKLDDIERAKLAAEILNETNGDRDTFISFLSSLNDEIHSELINRAEDEVERSEDESN